MKRVVYWAQKETTSNFENVDLYIGSQLVYPIHPANAGKGFK